MTCEVRCDVLDPHALLPAKRHPDDLLAELLRIRLRHDDVLPRGTTQHHRSDVTPGAAVPGANVRESQRRCGVR